MPKRTTNEEFVSELMNFSKFGALSQVFIMEAIGHYSKQVAEMSPEQVQSPFINGEAWVGVAKEINQKLETRFKDV